MTATLAAQQISKLEREKESLTASINEFNSRIMVLEAQIAGLTPLATLAPPAQEEHAQAVS